MSEEDTALCPFCGSNSVSYYYLLDKEVKSVYGMQCRDCGAKGPKAADKEQAIAVWNKRYKK